MFLQICGSRPICFRSAPTRLTIAVLVTDRLQAGQTNELEVDLYYGRILENITQYLLEPTLVSWYVLAF